MQDYCAFFEEQNLVPILCMSTSVQFYVVFDLISYLFDLCHVSRIGFMLSYCSIVKTLEWESWEQHCIWTLVSAHAFKIEEFISLIPQLDAKKNSEALTALLLILRRES